MCHQLITGRRRYRPWLLVRERGCVSGTAYGLIGKLFRCSDRACKLRFPAIPSENTVEFARSFSAR